MLEDQKIKDCKLTKVSMNSKIELVKDIYQRHEYLPMKKEVKGNSHLSAYYYGWFV